jgi:hypothetical protein
MGRVVKDVSLLRWGRVQAGFTNAKADARKAVSVKTCASDDTDGSTETGDAFDVLTPIRKNKATALFTGDVTGYVTDLADDSIIITDCFDDPLGVVKQWDDVAGNIPDGWSELTDAKGRYIVGVDGSHALDATGGSLTHTHTHTYDRDPEVPDVYISWSACMIIEDHGPTNHEPPWFGLYNIKRTS